MKNADGVVMVYSVTSRRSLDDIPDEMEQVLRVQDKNYIPVVIVGTKMDLESHRQVSFEDAEELASLYRGMAVETSAKENLNVSEAFAVLIKIIKQYEAEESPKSPRVRRKPQCSTM